MTRPVSLVTAGRSHVRWLLPLLVFMVNTGARRGEVLALTWDRLDFDRGLVLIWRLPWLRREGSHAWVFPCPAPDVGMRTG